MTQQEIEDLLGRTLSCDPMNFNTYLSIAISNLETILCTEIDEFQGTLTYDSRIGYSTVFTDVFTEISEVKVDGDVTTDYSIRQWNKRTGDWFNSIVFDKRFWKSEEVEVTGVFGFDTYPDDIKLLIAQLFGLIEDKNKYDPTVKSKRVEDFQITFGETDLDADFYNSYSWIISKYRMCDIDYLRHGKVKSKCR